MSQQSRQELPDSDDPLVEPGGKARFTWLNLFRSLYVKTGGGNSSDNTALFLQLDADGTVGLYKGIDGTKLGKVTVTP